MRRAVNSNDEGALPSSGAILLLRTANSLSPQGRVGGQKFDHFSFVALWSSKKLSGL